MHPPHVLGDSQIIADGGGGHNTVQRDFIVLFFKMQDEDHDFFTGWV